MPCSTPLLVDRYERLSTPVVYDILDQMGYPNQALAADIRPLEPGMVVAGPAFTVEGTDARPDLGAAISMYQVFREIVPGSVLVMAMNGHRVAGPWGENTSITAKMRGARGIVIDGGTRDANPTVALGFPTFCRYVTPVFARGRYAATGYQRPVTVAGQVEAVVSVRPGDFVVADRDGVVTVPLALVDEVLVAAERLEEIEGRIRADLLTGEDREAVYRRHPKFDHVRKPGPGRSASDR
jgi:regulator of RNase E activity RraA